MLSDRVRKVIDRLKAELEKEELQRMDKETRTSILTLAEENLEMRDNASELERHLLDREGDLLESTLVAIDTLRLEKITRAVASGVRPPEMTEKEEEIYDSLLSLLKEDREIPEEEGARKKIVTILGKIPAFVGIDGREYGPFKPGDLVTLEREDIEALEKEGLVKEVDIEV